MHVAWTSFGYRYFKFGCRNLNTEISVSITLGTRSSHTLRVWGGTMEARDQPRPINMATGAAASFTWVLSTLQRISAELSSHGSCLLGRSGHTYDADETRISLEQVYRELIAISLLYELEPAEEEAVECVRMALQSITAITEDECCSSRSINVVHLDPRSVASDRPGRPRFDIGEEQLSCLIETGFSVPEIASYSILRVSVSTVRRRMSEYNLTVSVSATYSDIGDEELDHYVTEIQSVFPMCGNRQMMGILLSKGIKVKQHRVRESRGRRTYSVPSPRSLWHIDGNHKLIRCVIVFWCIFSQYSPHTHTHTHTTSTDRIIHQCIVTEVLWCF